MAKKQPPKPMFAVKGEFIESLDHTMQKANHLCLILKTLDQLGVIADKKFDELRKAYTELDQALFTKDE
jgi:hypothetical protein